MKLFLLAAFGLFTMLAGAQTEPKSDANSESDMNFWVGEWTCKGKSRNAPGKDEWTETIAKNSIKREMKGKVIQENFSMTGFVGKSWTVFNPNRKIWQQTWVDDSGAYLVFEGGREGKAIALYQQMGPKAKGKMRMVFQDFTKAGFRWLWQLSNDGGKSWETQWELNYTKKA